MNFGSWGIAGALLGAIAGNVAAANAEVYKCPGTPVLYTDQLSPQEARERGCKTIEGAPITIIQTRTPVAPKSSSAAAAGSSARPADTRVDAQAQRQRDGDSRRILDSELRQEQTRLSEMQREYNNGQPERQGNERNYQKYLDRVAEMKNAIARKESDIAAIKRELAKLPP